MQIFNRNITSMLIPFNIFKKFTILPLQLFFFYNAMSRNMCECTSLIPVSK